MMRFISSFLCVILAATLAWPQIIILPKKKAAASSGIEFIQTVSQNKTVNSLSHNLTMNNVASGNQLVLSGAIGSNAESISCSDSSGSTWSTVVKGISSASVSTLECHTFNVVGSGTITVTVSWTTTSTFGMFFLSEISGATVLDQQAESQQTTADTTWTYPTVTNTASGITFACAGNGLSNSTHTAGPNYTLPANGTVSGGNQSALCQYRMTSAGSQTPTSSSSASLVASLTTFSFK